MNKNEFRRLAAMLLASFLMIFIFAAHAMLEKIDLLTERLGYIDADLNDVLYEINRLPEIYIIPEEPSAAETVFDIEPYEVSDVRITHYCSCQKCCGKWANGIGAYGDVVTAGRTIACSSAFLPYGTHVLIDGHEYVVEDTGVHGRWIDIYCDSHDEAIHRGTFNTTITVLGKEIT